MEACVRRQMKCLKIMVAWPGLLLTFLILYASTAAGQPQYTIVNLGTLASGNLPHFSHGENLIYSIGADNNNAGQVVGGSRLLYVDNGGHTIDGGDRIFRTAPNSPINPATDYLGGLFADADLDAADNTWPFFSEAYAINDFGEVTGSSRAANGEEHAIRTAANSAINPATDDLGTLGGGVACGLGINNAGQVVGLSSKEGGPEDDPAGFITHAFRTSPYSTINPAR